MRLDVILPIFLSVPVGLIIYLLITKNINVHLRTLSDKISFFFWPYGPGRMLIIRDNDDKMHIYYDDDFEEISSEDRTLIRTIDGLQFVAKEPMEKSSIVVSLFEATAPTGYNFYSPFAVAWRWIVAISVTIYLLYIALVVAWIPGIQVQEVQIGGHIIPIAIQRKIDPWEAMLTTTIFFVGLTWMLVNVQRMADKTILYGYYLAAGTNPPHTIIVPAPTTPNVPLLDFMHRVGRTIRLVVPETLINIINKLGEKVGSEELAAAILAKVSTAETWRKAFAKLAREQTKVFLAGETEASLKLNVTSATTKTIAIGIIMLIVGVIIGFGIANFIGIGVAPAQEQPQPPGYGNQTQIQQPGAPGTETNQTQVSPPEMPPPPSECIGGVLIAG